jgi:O-antigen/teichoic acid export membrane protein
MRLIKIAQLSLLKRNILANSISSFWAACMSLAFIPLYIHFMGIEAFGLIGIFITTQAMFALLDMGISTTLNREMARLSAFPGKGQEMRDLLRTLEVIYWVIAILVMAIVIVCAPYISHKWVHGRHIPPAVINQAIMIMGIAIPFQLLTGFYSGGLLGLQKQVLLGGVKIFINTLRGVGAVLILWLVSPTIQAFFLWQIFTNLLHMILVSWFLWHRIPIGNSSPTFRMSLLKGVWHFAAGMSGITITAIILSQMDKVILSKLLSLELFGYYVLAGTVAVAISHITAPIFSALYPHFTQLAALNDKKKLTLLYHQAAQLVSVLILPSALLIIFFSEEILSLWKQDPVTVENTYLILRILTIGTMLNGLMFVPYALQLAYGWTKLGVYQNLISIAVLVPLVLYLYSLYGVIGAAFVGVILNSSYVLIGIQIIHHRFLIGEQWRWYWQDISMPLIASITVTIIGKLFLNVDLPRFQMFIYLTALLLSSFVMSIIASSQLRPKIYSMLTKSNEFLKNR